MDDGSKSNSVASQQSFQSTCRSVSSHSSSMNSLPGAVGPDGVVGSTRDKSVSRSYLPILCSYLPFQNLFLA